MQKKCHSCEQHTYTEVRNIIIMNRNAITNGNVMQIANCHNNGCRLGQGFDTCGINYAVCQ